MILHTWPCFPYPYKKRILTWPGELAHHLGVRCARLRALRFCFCLGGLEGILVRLRECLLEGRFVERRLLDGLLALRDRRHLRARLEGVLHIRRRCKPAHTVVLHAVESSLLLCRDSWALLPHEVLVPCRRRVRSLRPQLQRRRGLIRDVQPLEIRSPIWCLLGMCKLRRRRRELLGEVLEVWLRRARATLLESIELGLDAGIRAWRRPEALHGISLYARLGGFLTDLRWGVTADQAVLLQGPIDGGVFLEVLQSV